MDLRYRDHGQRWERAKNICVELIVSEESEGSVTMVKSPSDAGDGHGDGHGGWFICTDELYFLARSQANQPFHRLTAGPRHSPNHN